MKKLIAIMAVCAILLNLCSCAIVPPSTSAQGTQPTASTSTTDPTVTVPANPTGVPTEPGNTKPTEKPIEEIVLAPLPEMEREEVGALVAYDPDREIYFLTGHFNIVDKLQSLIIYAVSKEALDVSTMSMSLPMQTNYSVRITEETMKGANKSGLNENSRNQFSYYLYQVYQGKDFKKLAQLEWDAEQLKKIEQEYFDKYFSGSISYEELNAVQLMREEAEEAYVSYRDAELEAYKQLKAEDIPQFHVYKFYALWPMQTIYDESFREVEITIADTVYQTPIGYVELRNETPFPVQHDWEIGGTLAGIYGTGNSPKPYNDGHNRISHYFSFRAEWYMVLTDLVLEDPSRKVERLWVSISAANGLSSSFYWDMTEPLEIYAGDYITIDLEYYDPASVYIDYETALWGYLIYEYEGGTACKSSQCMIYSGINFYELYAMVFDGIDMEDYYWDYYYLFNQPWRYDTAE